MNLNHLGDALDRWKGSVTGLIGSEDLQVVPMLTDAHRWTQDCFEAYARLLRVKVDDILKKGRGDVFSKKTRKSYFCDLGNHDLFLDPDTGIAPDEKAKKEHISFSEIAALLAESRTRMLLIYQNASREKDWPLKKLQLFRSVRGFTECGTFAYDSGAVSMVAISQNRERIHKALACLKTWLGPVVSKRIIE